MRILITGKGGRAGSWAMRGEQLGKAMGATVLPNATDAGGFDIAVVVKRTPPAVIAALRGRKWVWDVVDAYPQPESYAWTRGRAVQWIRDRIGALKPAGVIWPTQRMSEDCDTGLPGMVLPHHHRIGIAPNPIRAEVKRVGYEGSPGYLGRWEPILRKECERRGWEFVINPPRLADLDIVVAFRDCGYVSRHWKSGVKLANAHASGTPFVGLPESGYLETACGAEYWADNADDIRMSFDWLTDQSAREHVSDRFRQGAYSVDHAAKDLTEWLSSIS